MTTESPFDLLKAPEVPFQILSPVPNPLPKKKVAGLIMNETCCKNAGIPKRATASRPSTPSRQHDVNFYIGVFEHLVGAIRPARIA
jgi:hypothetical protein